MVCEVFNTWSRVACGASRIESRAADGMAGPPAHMSSAVSAYQVDPAFLQALSLLLGAVLTPVASVLAAWMSRPRK